MTLGRNKFDQQIVKELWGDCEGIVVENEVRLGDCEGIAVYTEVRFDEEIAWAILELIELYFSDWFGNKRYYVWCQLNRESAITIQIWFLCAHACNNMKATI